MTEPTTPPPGNQPPGNQQPYGQPQWVPPPPPPKRQRPRARWFIVAGALILVAPVIFVGALFSVLRPLTQEDAVFSASDGAVQVDLPAGEERALFTDGVGGSECRASDGEGELELRGVTGDFTYNEWTAVYRFDTGDGDVTLECRSGFGDERYRVAQLPSTGGFVAGIVIGVVAPLLLGGIGLIWMLILVILFATGRPRDQQA